MGPADKMMLKARIKYDIVAKKDVKNDAMRVIPTQRRQG